MLLAALLPADAWLELVAYASVVVEVVVAAVVVSTKADWTPDHVVAVAGRRVRAWEASHCQAGSC